MTLSPQRPARTFAAAVLAGAGIVGVIAAVAAAEETAAPAAPATSIVLVTLDTLRADHVGAYGYRFANTPHLDALAARGTRFARVDSSAPITLPSHASIFTGLQPPRHGVRNNGTFVLADEQVTVAELLRGQGYDTAAAVAAVVVAERFGLRQGFRLWDEELVAREPGLAAEERDAAAVTDAALALLPELRPPFFLWVHYYDPHFDYRPPDRLLVAQRGPHRAYDAEVAYADEQLGRLLSALPRGTVVVAAGDHGEMLGDHGEETHGVLLHHGARRVPLLVAGPGVPAGRVVEPLVRTVDLAPTLLELAGAEPPAGLDGESFLPLMAPAGGAAEPPLAAGGRVSYSESFLPLFSYRWYPLRALSDGRWLFVDAPRPRLFDLAADPAEERDLATEKPAELERWRARLDRRLEEWGEVGETPRESPVAAEDRARLAALGYLSGAGRADDLAGLPDPYDLVDIAAELNELGTLVQSERCADALPRLRTVLRRNRDNLPALNMAGICLMDEGREEEALPYLRHALEVHPQSTVARTNVAGCLLSLGRPQEAEAAYRETLALDPTVPQAVANLAQLLRERGALDEAAAVLAAGFSAGGDETSWRLERGLLYVARQDLERALADFLAVVEAEPEHRVALENAAQAAYYLGRGAQAAGLYRRLAELDPSLPGPWKTLGAIQLYQLGDRAGARDSFARALAVETDAEDRAELEALLSELGG